MTFPAPLPVKLSQRILQKLGVEPSAPSISGLDALIAAYAAVVPWESASRLARAAAIPNQAERVCWAEQFWHNHLDFGSGGTCFESNFAFAALLNSLGYEGYLTINNMGKTVGCHTAIIVLIEGGKWLLDAGMPLYIPLPIDPHTPHKVHSPFLDYWVVPVGENRYQIERIGLPFPNAYTLIDQPTPLADYRRATIADYGADGLFLDAVIINRVIDGTPCRFNQREKPWAINRFEGSRRLDIPLGANPAQQVADFFSVDAGMLAQAWQFAAPND